jgi:F-type H+-transporting ATPase subunit delta
MTNRTAANRYARALFDVALKEADPQRIETELAAFNSLVESNQALQRVLISPSIPPARKHGVVEALLAQAGPVSTPLHKLLLLLASRDRFVLLPDLLDTYRQRLMQHLQVVSAELTTAVPVPDGRRLAIEQNLARATGQRVVLTSRVDPAIIGGAVTRVGSTVYDGSVMRQLDRLKEQLQKS